MRFAFVLQLSSVPRVLILPFCGARHLHFARVTNAEPAF
jgi:hypothetical protein